MEPPWICQDPLITGFALSAGQASCKAAGKTCEVKVYPDAPRGFNADYRPSYRPNDA
jgi:carboxymethylenebutenolidase